MQDESNERRSSMLPVVSGELGAVTASDTMIDADMRDWEVSGPEVCVLAFSVAPMFS